MTCSTTKTKGFQFKQFSIHDGNSGMPVSTDGVLLGAWARFHSSDTLLDIGTGTGLLTLMLAQRFIDAAITAVDIDETAIVDATYNIQQSPWQNASLCSTAIYWRNHLNTLSMASSAIRRTSIAERLRKIARGNRETYTFPLP
ncbi:tRNA (adenine37-N(6))-methyltransferase TrmN6 [Vibrio variabilis]|uniref:tRNA (Adenine37-N(6))-methyltransferase TrmN6 n=1 Tax=Vibrio variabilis TaxID=990271 RepID=A0ABQ0J7R4_9VIBR|nr:tRNA (adenine37-N(6))-methyltransferase TrmN6 [Vibrio variabilis]